MNRTVQEMLDDPMDRLRFPADPWALVETRPDETDLGLTETLFAVGNGYLGMRGNATEGRPFHTHGTFINGFHETWSIRHAEEAYGLARVGQTIVDVPDAKTMKIYVDDEPLHVGFADLESYRRTLDFRAGELIRDLVWRTPAGKRVRIRTRRMVSFTERHLALLSLEITMLDGHAPVVVSSQIINRQAGLDEFSGREAGSGLDPRRRGWLEELVLESTGHWHSDRRMILGYRTRNSHMTLAVGADHWIRTNNPTEELIDTEPDLGRKVYRLEAREGQPILITKAVAYHTSHTVPPRELFDRCRRTLDRVRNKGFEEFRTDQRTWLDHWWDNCDVEVGGDAGVQQAVRWNLFHLAQATARSDQMGVPAKALTGSGYEGHYFWDSETYVVPFLVLTNPSLARNVLRYRVKMLPKARERARELNQQGALFPWRTINGEEASAYYAAGTAQYHINADIAFALTKYRDLTGDMSFVDHDGAEVMVETARLWADLGFWREGERRSFHIHGVTGPDEYTTVVNNNLFTNIMARANLWEAATLVRWLIENDPLAFAQLRSRLGVTMDEVQEWEAAGDAMVIPYDDVLRVHPQAEHFLDRELWDLGNTPAEMRPLLLHYHPLVIYRFQVLKQADVVLALFLQGDQFALEAKRRDFEYYDPITTGDSSLSAVVQSVIAAEVGYQGMAMRYFLSALYVDLADLHANTDDGVHIASCGGVWTDLVYGFGGLRDYHGVITFDPRLPERWEHLQFRIQVRGTHLLVRVEPEAITLTVRSGPDLEVRVRGVSYVLSTDAPTVVALPGQVESLPDLTGTHPVVGDLRADGTVITANVPAGDPDPDEPPVGAHLES